MKRTKTQKGITLIALIITIIVLLILAVVAIKAIQNDGIIEHAKNARESYQTAQRNEQSILDSYLAKLREDKDNLLDGGNNKPTEQGTPCTACSYGYLNEYEAFVCSSCGSRSDVGCSGYELIRCETHGIQIHDTSWGADYNYECPVCKVPGTFLRDMGGNYLCANCSEYTSVLPIRCPFKCTYGVIYGTAVALMGEDSVNVKDTIELNVKDNTGATVAATEFVWESSDESVATVNNGVVTGVKESENGTSKVTITATHKTDNSVVATKKILVKPMAELTGENSVEVRDTIQLTLTKEDGTTLSAEDFTWDSSDKTLATVNNGVVTGVKALKVENTSKTTITATLKEDNSIVLTKEIIVKPIDCPDCENGRFEKCVYECPDCGKISENMDYKDLPPYFIYCSDCYAFSESEDDPTKCPSCGSNNVSLDSNFEWTLTCGHSFTYVLGEGTAYWDYDRCASGCTSGYFYE